MKQLDLMEVHFDSININRGGFQNCRKASNDLGELRTSIEAHGLLTPLTVWFREGEDPEYILVSGHQRYSVLESIRDEAFESGTDEENLPFTKLMVAKFTGTLSEALAVNLTENVQREDLNPADRAEAVHSLVNKVGTQTEVAVMLGKSQPWVSQQSKLVTNLIPQAMQALRQNQITLRQALTLSKFVDKAGNRLESKQLQALDKFVNGAGEDVEAPRVRNYRSKKEVEDMRVLILNEDEEAVDERFDGVDFDESHRASLQKFVRWFFMEIDDADLFETPVLDDVEISDDVFTEDPEEETPQLQQGA